MHEIAIAKAIVEGACAEAHRLGLNAIRRIRCRVGVLRQIDGDLLCDAFELARGDSACSGATLEVVASPMAARCPACGIGFEITGWDWSCPRCGAEGLDLRGGDELEIISISTAYGVSNAEQDVGNQATEQSAGSMIRGSQYDRQQVGFARDE